MDQASPFLPATFASPSRNRISHVPPSVRHTAADGEEALFTRLSLLPPGMSRVQSTMGASGNMVYENYTLGDVLTCKAHRGKLAEVKFLLEDVHADVNYRNKNGCTALHGAAAAGQLSIVQFLLGYPGVDMAAVDDDEQTALHYAAFYGHLEVVQVLVERGVPLDIPDKYGRLAHCSAAINGHLDVVTYLLEECPTNPIDINSIDEYGSTCLHWAASKGRKEVVQYLCTKGIDVHVTSYDNKSAYQLAKDKQKHKCVQYLQSWYEMAQKFVHAAEDGEDEELRRIIDEINDDYPLRFMRDKNGKNAMHWAAEEGHLSTLKLLGDHFDVWTDVDKLGHNALHCAALGGHKDCVFWLIRYAKNARQFLCLTTTNKTPSRCAFEAGHSALAARLQAWEEGNEEYSKIETDVQPPAESRSSVDGDDPEKPSSPKRARDFAPVRNWLKSLNMDEYTKNFEKDGFDTLRGVATIDEDDLVDMRVKKGHRRVVLTHIEELRLYLAAFDESCIAAGKEPESSPTFEMLLAVSKPALVAATTSSTGSEKSESSARSERAPSSASIASAEENDKSARPAAV